MKSVLSNVDINRLYGKEIFIYPFNESNMKGGSTYNLTASKWAYYIGENNERIYAVKNGKIIIPAHKTVLLQTEECIYVSDRICGTYHSKVKLVSSGIAHIGTTLDPKYFGTSLIALQNTTDVEKYINIGDTFVSLMLYRLSSRAKAKHDNGPGRHDIYPVSENDFTNIEDEIRLELKAWITTDWRINCELFIDQVKKECEKTNRGKVLSRIDDTSNILSILLTAFPICLFLYHLLWNNMDALDKFITNILNNDTYTTITVALIALLVPAKDCVVKLIKKNIAGLKPKCSD